MSAGVELANVVWTDLINKGHYDIKDIFLEGSILWSFGKVPKEARDDIDPEGQLDIYREMARRQGVDWLKILQLIQFWHLNEMAMREEFNGL